MNNFVQKIGKVEHFDGVIYILQVENSTIEIPEKKMFRCVKFPDDMMDNGHLKVGSVIHLAKMGNKPYYPDHSVYECLNSPARFFSADGSFLLDDPAVKPYPVEHGDFETFTKEVAAKMGSMESTDRERLVKLLTDSNMTKEEKMEEVSKWGILPVTFVESESLEKKSSLFFPAGKGKTDVSKWEKEKNVQMKEIVETIASFANSKSPRPCKLIIGIDDKSSRTTGLQNEIASKLPQMRTLDQVQNTFIVNCIRDYSYRNAALLSSLTYNWYKLGKDLILVIGINYSGQPVIVKDGKLPYRSGSSKNVIEGTQLVDYILDYQKTNH